MTNKRSLILKRAWDSFILSISMEKLKKPIIRNLLIFRKIKTMKLLKRYSYTYIEEYQFSPPSTPPLNHSTGRFSFTKKTLQRLLCHSPRSEGEAGESFNLEASVIFDDIGSEPMSMVLLESEEEEGDSVDRRAEKFIERFYEEMRIQRQESIVEYTDMLDRSCG